jgi:hypothetical protein
MKADIVTELIQRLAFKASREIRDCYGADNYLLEVGSDRLYFAAMDQGGNTVAEMSLEGLTIDLDPEPRPAGKRLRPPNARGRAKGSGIRRALRIRAGLRESRFTRRNGSVMTT